MKTTRIQSKNKKTVYEEISIRIPEMMKFVFNPDDDMGNTFKRDALLLYPFIMQGRISNGRAADILGVNKWELIEWYESQGLMCLSTSIEDAKKDLATLRCLRGGTST